jgi:hypothetical protein
VTSRNALLFYGEESHAQPRSWTPPLAGCPRLLIQDIRSYPPYLEGVSSIRNLRTRHAVVTSDPPNIVIYMSIIYIIKGKYTSKVCSNFILNCI